MQDAPVDLVLSSGFLAFARHIGFLQAVEDRGVEVGAVVGTSSGALVGALWAAGLSPSAIAEELGAKAPIRSIGFHSRPWQGLFSMKRVIARLRELLPPRFDDLPRPLAVGVALRSGEHRLLHQGDLPEAVAASCAIPHVFAPVRIETTPYVDGGAVDRLGLDGWKQWRPGRSVLVHWVERSAGRDPSTPTVPLVRSQRSGASFFSLGPFRDQVQQAHRHTLQVLPSLGLPAGPTDASGTTPS
jgi:predicted acylesterase/phospholipase RssA